MSVLLSRKDHWTVKGMGWGWWRGFLLLECPFGHRVRLGLGPDGHKVAADGTVTPSCVCPGVTGCSWHEWVRLEDWRPDEKEHPEDEPSPKADP